MTRKDYILLADALRDAPLINCPSQDYVEGVKAGVNSAVLRIADALQRHNPNFNRSRFLEAAGAR